MPKSVENDVAATQLSFGFNSALSFATETLDRARQAAASALEIAVAEVLGEHAGWLALQAGIAVCADAVLIPEIAYNPAPITTKLQAKWRAGRTFGLVLVAEGANPAAGSEPFSPGRAADSRKASISPNATGQSRSRLIHRSGQAADPIFGYQQFPSLRGVEHGSQPRPTREFENGFFRHPEPNRVVNPKRSVKPRAREF